MALESMAALEPLAQTDSGSEIDARASPGNSRWVARGLAGMALVAAVVGVAFLVFSTRIAPTSGGESLQTRSLVECAGSTEQERCDNACVHDCSLGANFQKICNDDNGFINNVCSQTSSPSNSCFPGDAVVQVDGRPMPIAHLEVGDRVLVESTRGAFAYEPVLAFIHSDGPGKDAISLHVKHEYGTLRISPSHVVFSLAGDRRLDKLASYLQKGDELVFSTVDNTSLSTRVESVQQAVGALGMYAPLTPSGTIVVDGVVASNYANLAMHNVAHVAFFPVRAYHQLGFATPFGKHAPKASKSEQMHPWASLFHNKYYKIDKFFA